LEHWFASLQKQIRCFPTNPKRPNRLWEPPHSRSVGAGAGVRRPRREVDHSPPSRTESRKRRNFGSSFHGVRSLPTYNELSTLVLLLLAAHDCLIIAFQPKPGPGPLNHELVMIFSVGELGVFPSFLIAFLAVDYNSLFLSTFILPSVYSIQHPTL